MTLTHGVIAWYTDDGEVTLCEDSGKLRAIGLLEDEGWNIYVVLDENRLLLGTVRRDLPDRVISYLVEKLLVGAAEFDWVMHQEEP